MNIKIYKESIDYLESFIGKIVFDVKSSEDPLERMRVLLNLLDNPQNKFKSILIGGTSGKGSTAYLISHILTTAGYKTGLTLSPHLQKINERLQINGKEVSDSEFTGLVSSLVGKIEKMKKMPVGAPSYFEILIAMAFEYFEKKKVDIAVVEVGMGGEFDATNTLNPLIAVLTNVGLDHTNILGKTVEKIARTKSGIIKKNKELRIMNQGRNHNSPLMIHDSIVVTGVKQLSVIKIIEEKCRLVGAELYRLGKDFDKSIIKNYKFSMLGDYQVENAALAIKTVLELQKFRLVVSEKTIRKALKTGFFPGRFENVKCRAAGKASGDARQMLNVKCQIVLDSAHNPVKMKAFLASLEKLYPKERKIFVVGFKSDKDIKKMLRQIIRVADAIVLTEFKAKTDMALHASAKIFNLKSLILNLKSNVKVTVEKDSEKALGKALTISNLAMEQFSNGTIIVVTGSLYLVGEVRSML